jgi:Protein of unknown function (DUF559).
MVPTVALAAFSGGARWADLKGKVSRRALRRAVLDGSIHHVNRLYSLPADDLSLVAAQRLRGVVSHRRAAAHWQLALPPGSDKHDVTLPPGAKRAHVPDDVQLHWTDLRDRDVIGGHTSPLMTVVLCLRDLSTREALSVGDAALRTGRVRLEDILARVAQLRGPGSARAKHRAKHLDANAANAFESSCRAILVDADIIGFEPQVNIRHRGRWIGRVDLADRRLLIVIECDGFETHGTLAAMTKDCVRHTCLVAAGWRPLRFTWYQVMHRPDWVLKQVRDTIAVVQRTAATTQRPVEA